MIRSYHTWPISGDKIVHIFDIPEPNLSINFVTHGELRQRLNHDVGENSIKPCDMTKFTVHAQYHVT